MYLQDIGLYAWLARGSSLGGEWLGPSGHGPPWEVVWISIYYGMLLPVVVCFQSYMTCLIGTCGGVGGEQCINKWLWQHYASSLLCKLVSIHIFFTTHNHIEIFNFNLAMLIWKWSIIHNHSYLQSMCNISSIYFNCCSWMHPSSLGKLCAYAIPLHSL